MPFCSVPKIGVVMTDSIISNAIKTSIDRPKYEGFNACADITFELLNGEKNKLIEKISSGSYLTSEEQYFLVKLESIMNTLNDEYNGFCF